MTQPVLADQGRRLEPLLAGDQSQVGGQHVQADALDLDLDPQGAARLQTRHASHRRQGAGTNQGFRMGCQDGVAILLGLDGHRRVEADGHLQAVGDGARLIHPAGAGAVHVQLLKADDVRFQLPDHASDPVHIEAFVHADTAMHIVGHKPHGAWARPIPE